MSKDPTWISEWNPEDETFWNSKGKVVARRNLIWSIVAEHVGFSVWLIWSIVATKLPQAGFHYTTDQLFQLVAIPGLIGSLMRFPYTFAVTTFGGRNWTIFSASVLLIPTFGLAYFVSEPGTPFWLMLLVASTAGLGGGNFASSMTNISFFYPDRMKGWALGLNAAGGNIGVSSVQLLTPILMGFGLINLYRATPVAGVYLQNAGLMWVLPLIVAVFGAIFFMNNLTSAKSSFRDQLAIVGRKHTWIMAFIYVGTFGSFIGYSAAFPLLIKTQFPAVTIAIAFLGPLVGSLSRPLGGLLADRVGGAIVTFWNFIAMGAATIGVLYFAGASWPPEVFPRGRSTGSSGRSSRCRSGGDEQDEEHRRKPVKSLMPTKYSTPIVAAPMAMKFQNVTMAPPTLSASKPPNGRDSEPTSGPRNAIAIVTAGNCVLISSGNAAE